MNGLRVRPLVEDIAEGASMPRLPMICGELVYEGDVCFLFGSPNCGKTPLAMAICEQFSGGQKLPNELRCEAENGVSLFLDCELSERQQGNRYRGSDGEPYSFNENILRATLDNLPRGENQTDAILNMLNHEVFEQSVRLLVIDNITALQSQAEKSFDAARLVYGLKGIALMGVTVIVIAHTPKRPDGKPVTSNCMAGSKAFTNLADSTVSVMPSIRGTNYKRIQQHKCRNSVSCSVTYGSENNLIVESVKQQDGLITFTYVGTSPERDHLPQLEDSDSKRQAIIQAKRNDPTKSNRAIAEAVGSNHTTVARVLAKESGTSGTSGTTVPRVPAVPSSNEVNDPFTLWDEPERPTNGFYQNAPI